MHLFAYGTLMCPDIMAEVSRLQRPCLAATLRGYRRLRVKGEDYPALLADAQGSVSGVIYHDITTSAWNLLDEFEGEMYSRIKVEVALADGSSTVAQTYVVNGSFSSCLEPLEWDYGEFLSVGKDRFRRLYKGYQVLG